MSDEDEQNYFTQASTIYSHYDWFLRQALRQTAAESWTMEEIIQAMKVYTGVQPHEDKLLSHLTWCFAKHQSAPLRRVAVNRYVIDDDYYALLEPEIHPPRPGGRGPRPRRIPDREISLLRSPRASADKRRRDRCHQKYYRRLVDHPEEVLEQAFEQEQILDLHDIRERISRNSKYAPFKATTIEHLLNRYIQEGKGPPFLTRTEDRMYRVRGPPSAAND